MKQKNLWATTKYAAYTIYIYKSKKIAGDGTTLKKKGKVIIKLAEHVFDDEALLVETVIHELMHAMEFYNAAEAFDGQELNECSHLVQTVSKGLAQMLMDIVVFDSDHPFPLKVA